MSIVSDIKTLRDSREFQNVESRKEILRFLTDVTTGSPRQGPPNDPGVATILSGAQRLPENVTKFLDSTSKSANAFGNILNATEKIAKSLGVKLDPEVQNALEAGKTIVQAIQTTNLVAQAFVREGLIGALGAFTGGPALGLLGVPMGADANAQVLEELRGVKQDIAEIKKMQIEILHLQRDTMKMIHDLAIMLDEYHQEEMAAIANLHGDVRSVKEMTQYLIRTDLSKCSTILTYGLSRAPHEKEGMDDFSVVNSDFNRIKFLKQAGGLSQIRRALSIADRSRCRDAFNDVFRLSSRAAVPLLTRSYIDQMNDDGVLLEDRLFKPALAFLAESTSLEDFEVMALHLPVIDLKTLIERKQTAIYQTPDSRRPAFRSKLRFELDDLISPVALEQYVSHLIVLYPFVSFGEDTGNILRDLPQGPQVDDAIATATSLSKGWLQAALYETKVAISQEALLAGEPLLPALARNWKTITSSAQTCNGPAASKKDSFCFVLSNDLMMKNLISFMVRLRHGTQGTVRYGEISRSGAVSMTAELANLVGVEESSLSFDAQTRAWSLKRDATGLAPVALPSAGIVTKGLVQYSEKMPRLIQLAQKIAAELVLVSPHTFTDEQTKELSKIMVLQY